MMEERSARVDSASSPTRAHGPQWSRNPPPKSKSGTDARQLLERAGYCADGSEGDPILLAAVMLAQAIDRLGETIIAASAIGTRSHGP